MNNEKEVIRLGFTKNNEGMYSLTGKHQTFIAKVINCNGPCYVSLYYQSKKLDDRPRSDRKGLPYVNFIKDCMSLGSLEKAIIKYDVEDGFIKRSGFGFEILK